VGAVLPRSFYARPTLVVTRDLIGKVLVHVGRAGTTAGTIVEVEAYIGESDPACHASVGFTQRNAPLYGPPGIAYVYLNYGVHYLVNAVTESEGFPAAVLIRALKPLTGTALMSMRRVRGARRRRMPLVDMNLCRGPGNLTCALGITLQQNRIDLCGDRLFIEDPSTPEISVSWSSRVGLTVGKDSRWRCYASQNLYVSACKTISGGSPHSDETARQER
jgi:DNA-3-methyladenine glycosylase